MTRLAFCFLALLILSFPCTTKAVPFPSASIADTTASITGPGNFEAVFTVTLSAPAGQAVMVDYETRDGTAISGSHYLESSGTLSIPANQTSRTITIPLLRFDFRPGLTFSVDLTGANHATIADGSATATIRTRSPSFSVGGEVPGEEVGRTFAKVGVPSINDTGDVAFLADIQTPLARKQAIFANEQIVVSKGDAVPELDGATFSSFSDPAYNNGGRIAFIARLAGAVNAGNNVGLFSDIGGDLTRVIRTGDPAPGIPGFTLTRFHEFSFTDDAVFFTCFLCNHRATTQVHYYSLCVWTPGGGTRLLMREGQRFGDRTISRIDTLLPTSGSPGLGRSARAKRITARLKFVGGSSAVVTLDADGGTRIIAQSGEVAPSSAGAKFTGFGRPMVNSGGGVSVQGFLNTSATAAALFGDVGGEFDRAYGVGDAVPGLPGITVAASDAPVYNEAEDIASVVTLTGIGLTGANNRAIIFKAADSAPTLVARLGDTPPGVPAGARWKSFISLAIPGNKGPLFVATMVAGTGGVTTANDLGLWAVDNAGTLRLVVRESDTINVDGLSKTVRTFTALGVVAGSPDQTRASSNNGYVAYQAVFTDGTRSVIRRLLPQPSR